MSICRLVQGLRFLTGEEDLPAAVFVDQAVEVWDSFLDLGVPLVIGADLDGALAGLRRAGMPEHLPLRWVDGEGRVRDRCFPGAETLVVGLAHPNEGWRERLPLFGRKLVLTRAAEKLPSLAEAVQKLGAHPFLYPVLSFEPLGPSLPDLEPVDWVLFTSPNGVEFFWDQVLSAGGDARSLARARLGCIGPSTARALLERGLRADLVPPEFVAESFLEALSEQALEGSRILIPRALEAREVLPEGLRQRGALVEVLPVYRTVRPSAELELPEDLDAVLLTSSSTVRHFLESSGRKVPAACIGPVTAATARELGFPILCVAREHTVDGLLEALQQHFAVS